MVAVAVAVEAEDVVVVKQRAKSPKSILRARISRT